MLRVRELTLIAKTRRALRRPERQSYFSYVLLHVPSYSEGFNPRALSIESLMSPNFTELYPYGGQCL
jgi:hypothetical protein